MPGLLAGPVSGIMDRQKGKGSASQSFLQRIGTSAAQAAGAGNIACTVASVASPISPGSNNNDNVLVAWVLPAGLFDIAGRGICVTAMGSVAANVNSKRIKIIIGATTQTVGSAVSGGTTIADTGAYTTNNAVGWSISAQVFKYGNPASNTQIALHQSAVIGLTNSTLVVPTALTLTESGAINLCITGNAVTTASDIALNFAELFATN